MEKILSFGVSVLAFLIMLGPLVIVHEFGHFLFARLFGVKAEVFSVGFGPKLWKKMRGETEWCISAIPLGGYVKLLGEDREAELSPEEQARALHKQAPWKRFFIFFGGPFFNFVMAVFLFMLIFIVGEPKVDGIITRIIPGTVAEKAGFKIGDRVLSMNGKSVRGMDEVISVVNESPHKNLKFEIQRQVENRPQTQFIEIIPTPQEGYSLYGESTHLGEIDGLFSPARTTDVGVSNPQSLVGKAGVRTGDRLVSWNGTLLKSWEEVDQRYKDTPVGKVVQLQIQKNKNHSTHQPEGGNVVQTLELTMVKTAKPMGEAWGLHSSELFIDRVIEKSPAAQAGLKAGDRLIGVGGKEVQSFFQLKEKIQGSGEKTGQVHLLWEREGKRTESLIVPTATETRDPVLKKVIHYTIGVVPKLQIAELPTYIERVWNPLKLVYLSVQRMFVFTWHNFVTIKKMLVGDVSVSTLGGPIMIGKIAGESLTRGLISFLTTMAMLSVGLGVLNILPVPVLDGGHLMILAIESVRRKPLNLRTMEIIQLVGLSLILMLMAIVIRNDIARLVYY